MANLPDMRSHVLLLKHGLANTASTDYPGNYTGYPVTWNLENVKKQVKIKIMKLEDMEIEFDFVGVDSAFANAIRRILISAVPSMAIEKVSIYNNTSIIQDEVLAHRLGLIPLKADPRMFEYRQEDEEEGSELDTLLFELKVKCSWNQSRAADIMDEDDMYVNNKVTSKHIKWIPIGNQAELYKEADVGPVHDDIVLAKMRPGQEMDLKLIAVKGTGRDHAKFSPVAPVFYRLLPEITLLREVENEEAELLQKCFSPGVIGIENENGRKVAKVLDARYDSCSRNVFRYRNLKDAVKLSRVQNHFIYTIASVGALSPDALFVEALKILSSKVKKYINELNKTQK